jgi:hypothetical protein
MEYLHQERKKKGVTLQLLWHEYKETNPDGYQYSQFCERYHQWRKTLDVCLHQEYRAGEKLFVDYAGQTIPIQNPFDKLYGLKLFGMAEGFNGQLNRIGTARQRCTRSAFRPLLCLPFFHNRPDHVPCDTFSSALTVP